MPAGHAVNGWLLPVLVLVAASNVVATVWTYNLVLTCVAETLLVMARVLRWPRRPWMRWAAMPERIHHELRPFALPGLLWAIGWAAHWQHWWTLVSYVMLLGIWWQTRNWPHDDDRWRRRRRRLAATVQRHGGRLVISPATP